MDGVDEDGGYPPAPTSSMGAALLHLVQTIWRQGVPAALQRASIVSIFKDGDSADPNNYRGISLCETALKLVTGIFSGRLMAAVEPLRLVKEQAGFRARQECSAQVASLLEMCKRRALVGECTFLAFLDFKKAFDMVPHAVLLHKLEHFGVRGRALQFVRSLYAQPMCAVRGDGGAFGDDIRITRGVRQGCPLSPILFDIFINDVLECVRDLGIRVPSLGRRIPGLLFADDIVLLAESAVELQGQLDLVARWAKVNGMTFGTNKCGVMAVNGDMPPLGVEFILDGDELPRVSTYKYLGVPFNNLLSMEAMADARAQKGDKLLRTVTPFLRNVSLPVTLKRDVIRTNVIPVLSYGGEIFGMSRARVQGLERVLRKSVAALTGGWGRAAYDVMLLELGIPSIYAKTSALRRRALLKYPDLVTVIGELCSKPFSSRHATWFTGASRWMATQRTKLARLGIDLDTEVTAAQELDAVSNQGAKTKAWNRFLHYSFGSSSSYLETLDGMASFTARHAIGIAGLVALRTNGLMFAPRAAKAGILGSYFETHCPCCGMASKENAQHFLLKCSAFSEQRTLFLGGLRRVIRKIVPAAHLSSRTEAVILLGGVRNGFSLGKNWFNSEDAGDAPSGSPYCLQVIKYLQAVYRKRCALVWRNSVSGKPTPSRGRSRGMVALSATSLDAG